MLFHNITDIINEDVVLMSRFKFFEELFTCFINICNIGEEVVALRFGHREAQLPGIFKHADQNLQAQQVRMLRRYHFKYGLLSLPFFLADRF